MAAGELDRLMIFMPPGSAKSTYASVLFPAWFMARAGVEVIGASYNAELAEDFSGRVQSLVREHASVVGYALETENRKLWRATNGSSYRAAGAGGGITGRRADCVLGSTQVITEDGVFAIRDIAFDTKTRYILSYDGVRPQMAPIVAWAKKETANYLRVRTASGRVVEATGEHKFYTTRGFVPAALLAPGDGLLRLVWNGESQVSSGDPKAAGQKQEWPNVLWPFVFGQGSECQGRIQEPSLLPVRSWHSSSAEAVSDLQGSISTAPPSAHSASAAVRVLRTGLSSKEQDSAGPLLFEGLQGQNAFARNERTQKSRLEEWSQSASGTETLGAGIQEDEAADYCERQFGLRGLHSSRSLAGASHQLRRFGQSLDEPSDALQTVSRDVARGREVEATSDTVVLVERICESAEVYDVQVAGSECFFANGVLVHNCVIIDDPVKGRAEAESETIRDSVWGWYRAEVITRLKPGARVVLILTRWHEDDLAGRLLAEMRAGKGDTWRVLSLPAIAEDRDPLGRKPGEPLWPEWEDLKALARKRAAVGPYEWEALYQQRPTIAGGSIIKREWWQPWPPAGEEASWQYTETGSDGKQRVRDMFPSWDYVLVALDTAYKEKQENDWTACTVWGVFRDQARRPRVMLTEAWRDRIDLRSMVERVNETCKRRKADALLIGGSAGAGHWVAQEVRRLMRDEDWQVIVEDERVDKTARLHATVPLFVGKVVHAPERRWADMVITETAQFPKGKYDDLVDTVSLALGWMRRVGLAKLASEDEREERDTLTFHGNAPGIAEEYGVA